MNNKEITNHAQSIIDARLVKAKEDFDASISMTEKITNGLKDILGNDPKRVLNQMPNYRYRGRRYRNYKVELTDQMKIESLIKAIMRDYKIIKCVRIQKMLVDVGIFNADLSDLKRTNNQILQILEKLASH